MAKKQGSVNPNGKSEYIKSIKDAEQALGNKLRQKVRKPRVNDEMIDMMEKQRNWRNILSEQGIWINKGGRVAIPLGWGETDPLKFPSLCVTMSHLVDLRQRL